jgi:hypothetical protein
MRRDLGRARRREVHRRHLPGDGPRGSLPQPVVRGPLPQVSARADPAIPTGPQRRSVRPQSE